MENEKDIQNMRFDDFNDLKSYFLASKKRKNKNKLFKYNSKNFNKCMIKEILNIDSHQEIIGILTNVSEEESSLTLIIDFAKRISLPKNKELATKLKELIGDKISLLNFEGKYLVRREGGL